jgi:hypothetical protein
MPKFSSWPKMPAKRSIGRPYKVYIIKSHILKRVGAGNWAVNIIVAAGDVVARFPNSIR